MKGFGYVQEILRQLNSANMSDSPTVLQSSQGAKVRVDGREVIQLSSNNYLGLTDHPRLKAAAIEAIEKWGAGTGSVRTIVGTFELHEELERRLASFKQTEAALVFQSGYTANVGVLTTLLDEQDIVISDELNHASIIDGIRLTKAARRIYRHCDMDDLEQALRESRHYRNRLVVTDGVFSMDGTLAPLPDVVALAEQYEALVMVDDAHASGVFGQHGKGTVDHFQLHGRVHLQVGTLSKAIGVLGGYVASSAEVREYLMRRARPYLFSTSHPPAVTAACLAALDVLVEEPQRMEQLWANTRFFQNRLRQLGFDIGHSQSPITPIMIGEESLTLEFSRRLLAEGVLGTGILYPTVPKGTGRVRTIVTAAHGREELELALERLRRVGEELQLI